MVFSYRFNNVLKIKEKIEENKKNQMANEQKKLEKEKQFLENLLNKKQCTLSKWNEIINDNNVVKIKELQKSSMYIENINKLIDKQFVNIKIQEVKLNESRNQLIEAKKQTKIFKKIKEKDYKDFISLQQKKEASLIDQLVTYKNTVNKGG